MRKPIRGINDNKILTPHQKGFLQSFIKSDLKDVFRLTGGTALSAFYLEHRLSEDLDFFSSEKIPFYIVEDFLKKVDAIETISYTKLFDRNIFNFKLKDGEILKTEFTHYPLKNLENTNVIDGMQIDGFLDIIVNKLCAIADRIDVKDYVDIYYAVRSNSNLSLQNLLSLAERKCEIKGIRHILKGRLLEVPEEVERLSLKTVLTKTDIEGFFTEAIKDIVKHESDTNSDYS